MKLAIANVIDGESGMLDAAQSMTGLAVFVNFDKAGGIRRVSLRPELDYEREPNAARRGSPSGAAQGVSTS